MLLDGERFFALEWGVYLHLSCSCSWVLGVGKGAVDVFFMKGMEELGGRCKSRF